MLSGFSRSGGAGYPYIDANFTAARSAMNLGEQQIVTLARNSFDVSFSTQQQRDRWKAELETMAVQAPGSAGPVS